MHSHAEHGNEVKPTNETTKQIWDFQKESSRFVDAGAPQTIPLKQKTAETNKRQQKTANH
ncbi:hypothetical protein [Vibrio quintilis]|uniref:hypothetical protein n=1 Tax=Vibrio quintilis TaxID=1117707 RepID=UPI000937C783|nr:hypothetical protein [Vibrio quintilis]